MEGNIKEESISVRQTLAFFAGLILIWLWLRPETPSIPIIDQPGSDNYFLRIDKLALKAPVVFSDSAAEAQIQNHLQSGVVHIPGSAMPGQTGNCYIVGHSSDYLTSRGDYKNVFARLPELTTGDVIMIQSGHQEFLYQVLETKVVAAHNLSVLSQETGGKKLLSLQTSYPVGTAQKRFIVVASLVEK